MTALLINGRRRELGAPVTVADAVEAVDAPARGVAVAVDGEVVPRAEWEATELSEGQRVEVLQAVQGG